MSNIYMYLFGIIRTCKRSYRNWKYQRDMAYIRNKNLTFTKTQKIMDFQDYTFVNIKK